MPTNPCTLRHIEFFPHWHPYYSLQNQCNQLIYFLCKHLANDIVILMYNIVDPTKKSQRWFCISTFWRNFICEKECFFLHKRRLHIWTLRHSFKTDNKILTFFFIQAMIYNRSIFSTYPWYAKLIRFIENQLEFISYCNNEFILWSCHLLSLSIYKMKKISKKF